jgi:malate dehydrogenase
MKISIIGAGNVGATLAERIIEKEMADVVLLDIAEGMARGKALDLMHAAPLMGYGGMIRGTASYSETKGSDVAVITAGFPRQPGMTRADLIARNGEVVREAVENIKSSSPDSVIIIVTNPLDVMAYLAYKLSGFDKSKVFGMAGVLDTSRFTYILSRELGVPYADIDTIVLGQHGPDMVPIISRTRIAGKPMSDLVPEKKRRDLVKMVQHSGSEIVALLGKGSAFYAPSAAALKMLSALSGGRDEVMSVSCLAQGEYGISDTFTGLPVRLSKGGIKGIVDLELTAEEGDALRKSAAGTKELIDKL